MRGGTVVSQPAVLTDDVVPVDPARSAVVRRRKPRAVRRALGLAGTHVAMVVICGFALAPLLWAISSAFKSDSEIMTGISLIPTEPTLDHFRTVMADSGFGRWFLNSLLVSLGVTFLSIVVGSLAGYAMSRWRFRGKGLYGNSLLAVQMFPGVMLAIPMYLLLTRFGLIDTLWALLVTYLTFALAFSVWMLKGYFDGIPREIEEAALVDGLTRLGALRHVILPLAGPGIVTVAVNAFLLSWNEFFFAYVFLATTDKFTLSLGLYSFIQQFTTQWGNIMAAGVLSTIPVLIFFFMLQKSLTRGLVSGATKG